MIDLMHLDLGEARFGLATLAFHPSSVHQFSRIAEDREMLTDPRVDEVFFTGLGLQAMTKTVWHKTHLEGSFAISM